MEVEYYAVTHSGLTRSNNEDYFSVPSSPPGDSKMLAVIADGMGGHKSGEIASKLAVDTFVKEFNSESVQEFSTPDRLIHALNSANQTVYKAANDKFRLNNMGTTLTACCIENNKATFLNVGDSRAYIVHNDIAEQITKDHSVVQELLLKDIITEEEAENHPQKNMITRAIGIESEVNGDLFSRTLTESDCIMLCTDGLSKHIPIENVGLLFDTTCTTQAIANTLLDLALAKGGTDNITIITIRCK